MPLILRKSRQERERPDLREKRSGEKPQGGLKNSGISKIGKHYLSTMNNLSEKRRDSETCKGRAVHVYQSINMSTGIGRPIAKKIATFMCLKDGKIQDQNRKRDRIPFQAARDCEEVGQEEKKTATAIIWGSGEERTVTSTLKNPNSL